MHQLRWGKPPRRTVPEDGGNSDEPAAHLRREHKSKPPVHTGGFDSTRRTIEANVQLAGRQIQLQKGGENKLWFNYTEKHERKKYFNLDSLPFWKKWDCLSNRKVLIGRRHCEQLLERRWGSSGRSRLKAQRLQSGEAAVVGGAKYFWMMFLGR